MNAWGRIWIGSITYNGHAQFALILEITPLNTFVIFRVCKVDFDCAEFKSSNIEIR